MKTFTSGFSTEIAKQTGITPVWILRLTIAGTRYDLSDVDITFPASMPNNFTATKPWIGSWGEVRESISGAIGEMLVSDFSVSILVDQSISENIYHLALAHPLEDTAAELYLWFNGLTIADPPKLMFKGYVQDISIPDQTRVDLTIEDESNRLQKYIGTRVSSEVFPFCDPETVGMVIPIVYGNVPKLPALCVDGGFVSSIKSDISSTDSTLKVSEIPQYLMTGKVITIDDEDLYVLSGNDMGGKNYALTALGGIPSSTSNSQDAIAFLCNGVRRLNPGGNYWLSARYSTGVQTLSVTFAQPIYLESITIYFVDDTLALTSDPDEGLVGTLYVHSDFVLSYYNGTTWTDVLTTTTNDKVKVVGRLSTPALATQISARLNTYRPYDNYYSAVELEGFGSTETVADGRTFAVLRGYNSTTATTHTKGTTVIEKKTSPLVYLVADHAVDSIGTILSRIRGVNIDITSDCTTYTGSGAFAPGGQLTGYPGKAAFTIAEYAKVMQKIKISLDNQLSVSQGDHTHPATSNTLTFKPDNNTMTGSGWVYSACYADKTYDNNSGTYAAVDGRGGGMVLRKSTAPGSTGAPLSARVAFYYSGGSDGFGVGNYRIYWGGSKVAQGGLPQSSGQTIWSPSFTATSWSGFYTPTGSFRIEVDLGGTNGKLYEVAIEVTYGIGGTYSPATGVALLGSLGIAGNSVADIMIGDQVLVDVTRNISSPFAVINDICSTYCGDTSLTQVGTFPANYALNGAITEYKTALEWIDYLAFQCQAYFRKIAGISRLIVRTENPTAQGTIAACCLTDDGIRDVSFKKAALTDVINTVKVFFFRDWTKSGGTGESYDKSTASNDQASINIYGPRENPSMFLFDFVTSQEMAQSLAQFYVGFYGDRKWRTTFTTYLNNAKYEFGDIITVPFLPFSGDLIAQIVEAGVKPGSINEMDRIQFVVESAIIPVQDPYAITSLLGDQLIAKPSNEVIIYV